MGNDNLLCGLKETILQQLSGLIDSDYVYLELPYYENPGDILIWEGTEQFLSTLPYRCLYKASLQTYVPQNLTKDVVILLQGGGNFGDLWGPPHQFRKRIITEYPDNKIIILPQTVYYDNHKHAKEDCILFRLHTHLTICARDRRSYWFLKLWGFSKDIRLVPDMAFMISASSLAQFRQLSTRSTLLVERIDKELSLYNNSFDFQFDVKQDWPTYMQTEEFVKRLNQVKHDNIGTPKVIDDYADKVFRPQMVELAVKFLSPFEKVVTTRLHAGLLSILLGIDTIIVDNSYGKNRSLYECWLKEFNKVCCVGDNSKSLFSISLLAEMSLAFVDYWRIKLGAFRKRIAC